MSKLDRPPNAALIGRVIYNFRMTLPQTVDARDDMRCVQDSLS